MDIKTKESLETLREAIQENRTDIAEILEAIIKGEKWDETQIECRYHETSIDGYTIVYDSCRCNFEINKPNGEFIEGFEDLNIIDYD